MLILEIFYFRVNNDRFYKVGIIGGVNFERGIWGEGDVGNFGWKVVYESL